MARLSKLQSGVRTAVFVGRLAVALFCFAAFTAVAEVQIRAPFQRIVVFGGSEASARQAKDDLSRWLAPRGLELSDADSGASRPPIPR